MVPKYFHVTVFVVMARDFTCHFVQAGHVLLGAQQVVIITPIHVGIVIAADTTTSLALNAGVGGLQPSNVDTAHREAATL
jgi:hypothetical protein